ncbi:MAG: hypothetical protein AB1598_03850 [Thermodesulfobacteriota bacterium]
MERQSFKNQDNTHEKRLNHNNEGKDLGSFSLDVRVPLISFEEVREVTNPTRSKHYRGAKDLPLRKLIAKKAEDRSFRAYYQ